MICYFVHSLNLIGNRVIIYNCSTNRKTGMSCLYCMRPNIYCFVCYSSDRIINAADAAKAIKLFSSDLDDFFGEFYVYNSIFSRTDSYRLLEGILGNLFYPFDDDPLVNTVLRKMFANGVVITNSDQLSFIIKAEKSHSAVCLESGVPAELIDEYLQEEKDGAVFVEDTFVISLLMEYF